jgi:nicotinate-nucleotide adenylyltransferase
MTIGLFFGSFNPVHLGHLQLAKAFFDQTIMDELWWMISPQNPHKNPVDLAPFEHRMHMLRDAVQYPHFTVSDFESHLPTPSYTIDTLSALKTKFPNYQWKILMGQDSWNALPTWKCGDTIENQFEIWVYGRPESKEWRNGNHHVLTHTPLPISSTKIRNQIQSGVSTATISEILPITQSYIRENQLYQEI